jgi:hypothetical protein
MAQSMFDQASERISGTAHKASRASSAAADAVEDGARAVLRSAKQGAKTAEVLLQRTNLRLRRHPYEAVAATLAAGMAAAAALIWVMRRKRLYNRDHAQRRSSDIGPPLGKSQDLRLLHYAGDAGEAGEEDPLCEI